MNILITTGCNKGCSFCFARDKNTDIKEISYEDFVLLLDFIQRSNLIHPFKLLGGEPTTHSQFVELVRLINERRMKFTLITNMLYSDNKISEILEEAIKKKTLVSFLINASELDILPEKRIEQFIDNVKPLNEFSKQDAFFSISYGLTLNRNKTVEEEVEYIRWLLGKIPVQTLRLSLDFIGGNKDDTFFINNKNYGNKITGILKYTATKLIPVNCDCIMYPCIFEDEVFFRKQAIPFINNYKAVCTGETIPFDVYPDLSYFHCYPANNFRGNNILQFENFEQASRDMVFRKNILEQHKKIPDICKECKYYREGLCHSLCLGCLENNSQILQGL